MTIELLACTQYANIYGLADERGKIIGTKEVRLAGRDVRTYYGSWSAKTKAEIKKLFKQTERAE